jgi:hypothetical protein
MTKTHHPTSKLERLTLARKKIEVKARRKANKDSIRARREELKAQEIDNELAETIGGTNL